MFEVGKKYDIEMNDGVGSNGEMTVNTYPGRTITDVDGPLIKINDFGKTVIINTHCGAFVRATMV